jgi:hypothetical protein
MWVTILKRLLLRLVSHRHPGHSLHLRHHYNMHIHAANSQKGVNRPISRETSGRSPKLAQSTILCKSRSISTKRYPTPESVFTFIVIFFLTIVKIYLLHRLIESKKSPKHKKSFLRVTSISEATKSCSTKCSVSLPKSFYGTQRKVCRSYKKSFLRERSVSFLLKCRSKGNAESNTAKI